MNKCYEHKNDPGYDEDEDVCIGEQDLADFVGEEFLAATEQPQHYAIDPNRAILERIHWYYPKLFAAYMEDSGINMIDTGLSRQRKEFLKSSTRYWSQFLNMLYKINMSEEEFWKRYDKNVSTYQYNLRFDLYHTQRELPLQKDRPYTMMYYGNWISDMIEEIINSEYTHSLNLMAGVN